MSKLTYFVVSCIQAIFKDLTVFQGVFQARANHSNTQFSILRTLMAQLHLLRQLALFKRNANLQGITKYNLYHVHVQMLTEVKGKSYEKSQTETRLRSNGTIKEKIFLEKKKVRDKTNTKHELKRKQLKYKAMDTTMKQKS